MARQGCASRALLTPSTNVIVSCFAVALRLQVTDVEQFKDRSPYQAFSEYILCCIVLFLAVLNFMG